MILISVRWELTVLIWNKGQLRSMALFVLLNLSSNYTLGNQAIVRLSTRSWRLFCYGLIALPTVLDFNLSSDMDRKTGAIKKTIVRNVEVPPRLSENRRSVVQNFSASSGASSSAKLSGHDQRSSTTSRLAKENLFEQSVKYKVPQVNTSEKLIGRIERIQTMNTKKEVRLDKLTPRSKAVVSQEVGLWPYIIYLLLLYVLLSWKVFLNSLPFIVK